MLAVALAVTGAATASALDRADPAHTGFAEFAPSPARISAWLRRALDARLTPAAPSVASANDARERAPALAAESGD